VPRRLPLQFSHAAVRQGGGCRILLLSDLRGGGQRDEEPGRGVHPARHQSATDLLQEVGQSMIECCKFSIIRASLVVRAISASLVFVNHTVVVRMTFHNKNVRNEIAAFVPFFMGWLMTLN